MNCLIFERIYTLALQVHPGSFPRADDDPFGNKSIRSLALIYNRLREGSDSKRVKNERRKVYPAPVSLFTSTRPQSSMHEGDKKPSR